MKTDRLRPIIGNYLSLSCIVLFFMCNLIFYNLITEAINEIEIPSYAGVIYTVVFGILLMIGYFNHKIFIKWSAIKWLLIALAFLAMHVFATSVVMSHENIANVDFNIEFGLYMLVIHLVLGLCNYLLIVNDKLDSTLDYCIKLSLFIMVLVGLFTQIMPSDSNVLACIWVVIVMVTLFSENEELMIVSYSNTNEFAQIKDVIRMGIYVVVIPSVTILILQRGDDWLNALFAIFNQYLN